MILSVRDISISFGGVKALDGVFMDVGKGIIKGLIGPNGSGKTTLFNVISGFYEPSHGVVLFHDREVTGNKPSTLAKKGIARTFQGTILFDERTVFENILIATYSSHKNTWMFSFLPRRIVVRREAENVRRVSEILSLINLQKYRNEKVKNVPFGIRHFLEIGRCLALEPEIILLDEPTTGLNPSEQAEIIKIIGMLKDRNITVLIVEHNMKVIMNVCDRITVLDMGRTIAEGTVPEIRSNPQVIKSYLGKEAGHA